MTISSEIRKAGPFAGDGVTTSYPFDFKVFSGTDVVVVMADVDGFESDLVEGADYSVTLNEDQNSSPGGTVDLIGMVIDDGEAMVITSAVPQTQPVDLTNQGGFYPSVINAALDRVTILVQQIKEDVSRSLQTPITSSVAVDGLEAAILRLFTSADYIDSVARNIPAIQEFDSYWLGVHYSDPTTANDGGPLITGSVYFNATTSKYRVRSVGEWADGIIATATDAQSISFASNKSNSVTVNLEDKLSEIPSHSDFGADTAAFTYAANGGLAIIPSTTPDLGSYKITDSGSFKNASPYRLNSDFLNTGQAAGLNTARDLNIDLIVGTNIGRKRFTEISRTSMSGAGSTVAIDGTGDYAKGVFSYKISYDGSPSNGEIGGHYTVVRQGGSSATLNDCSAELYDVSTFSDSFACLTEGATTKITSGAISHSVRVITGFMNTGGGDLGGIATFIDKGAASHIDTSSIGVGATTQFIKYHVDLNRPSGRKDVYKLSGSGVSTTKYAHDLGTTIGSTFVGRAANAYSSNADGLEERLHRVLAGSAWQSAEWRINRTVDGTVVAGISFGNDATIGNKVSLTANGLNLLTVGSNLSVGFNGAIPITRPALPVAATDLASAIALTNSIRAALIAYGLAI